MVRLLEELGIALDQLRAQRQGPAGLARRREARLAAMLTHARTSSPFYRHLYRDVAPTRPSDGVVLAKLPPVTKQELMANFDDWVTDPAVTRAGVEAFIADPSLVGTPFLGRYFVCTTSGTPASSCTIPVPWPFRSPLSSASTWPGCLRASSWPWPAADCAGRLWCAQAGTMRGRAGCNGSAGAAGCAGAHSRRSRCSSRWLGSWQP